MKKNPADWILSQILLSKCKVAVYDHHEVKQTCSYAESPFWYSRWTFLINNFLEFLDYQDFDARMKISGFSIESSSTRVRLSYEILIDELKPGVAEKIEFEQIDVSVIMASSRIFGPWWLWRRTQNRQVFKVVLFYM